MDQRIFGKLPLRLVAPVNPCLVMKFFGKGLRKPVRDGFDHDGPVGIVRGVEFLRILVGSMDAHDKAADVIRRSGDLRSPLVRALPNKFPIHQSSLHRIRQHIFPLFGEVLLIPNDMIVGFPLPESPFPAKKLVRHFRRESLHPL